MLVVGKGGLPPLWFLALVNRSGGEPPFPTTSILYGLTPFLSLATFENANLAA